MLPLERIEAYRASAFRVRQKTIAAVGAECFEQSTAAGNTELRLPFLFEPVYFDLLADPKVLALVDTVLGQAAIVRFYNALITPPETGMTARHTGRFHQNFKVPLNAAHGPAMFMEITLPLTSPAQRFRILPGSHRLTDPPGEDDLEANAIPLDWDFGDVMLMTPFVWHREEQNLTDGDVASMFVQFSRPFIKPHADYVRAIDPTTWRAAAGADAPTARRLQPASSFDLGLLPACRSAAVSTGTMVKGPPCRPARFPTKVPMSASWSRYTPVLRASSRCSNARGPSSNKRGGWLNGCSWTTRRPTTHGQF